MASRRSAQFGQEDGSASVAGGGVEVPCPPAWTGWQLHQIADAISERLSKRGYAAMWLRPDLVENEELFTRGQQLVALMKECWPDEIRRRP